VSRETAFFPRSSGKTPAHASRSIRRAADSRLLFVESHQRQPELRQRLTALGFDDVRFASLAHPAGASLRDWLATGMQADMHWIERSVEKRLNPELVLPGAKSIVMLGVNYWNQALKNPGVARVPLHPSGEPGGIAASPIRQDSSSPIWARYALHLDYHDTIKPALVAAGRALESLYGVGERDYRYYVDTGPVLERGWAARAGIGFIGKNAMLISRRHGNWLFLAAILTTIEFDPDAPIAKRILPRATPTRPAPRTIDPGQRSVIQNRETKTENTPGLLCGKCTRCLDACPTNAFPAPGIVDARRCISYQTIENKGVIPRELRPGIGNRIYGCDVCLDVCPWNRFAQEGRALLLASRYDLAALTLEEILSLTAERFAEVFRRTPIKRLKLAGLLRNACVVAGNSADKSLLPHLLRLASTHELPLVRAHAVWAGRRLGGAAQLESARAQEKDPIVLAEYEQAD
jgi:epoxyqueuosine reductase